VPSINKGIYKFLNKTSALRDEKKINENNEEKTETNI
jgi:hypothetical protein